MKKYVLLFLVILGAGVSFVLQGAERERRISIGAGEETIELSEAQFEELRKVSEPIRDMLKLFEHVGEGVDIRIPLPEAAPETVRLLLTVLASPEEITRLKMDQLIPLIELYHFLKLDHKDLVDKEASLTHLFKQIGTQYKLDTPPDSPGRLPDDLERLFLQFCLGTLQFKGSVESVALSADGTIAMAGSDDHTAQIYEMTTGRLHTLQFNDRVRSVAFSADGTIAMAGSWDNTAQIYDVRLGTLLRTLRFSDAVSSVALSQYGKIAIAGSWDNTARIYNARTGRLRVLPFNDSVYSVALSADGTIAMAESRDNKAQIYNIRTGMPLHTLQFNGPVRSVALSQDGTIAMAGSWDHTAQIYDVRSGTLLRTLRFNDRVRSVALSQDGTIAMAGSWDKTAQIYDGTMGGLLHTLRFSHPVFSVALSRDGKIAMAGSGDKMAKIIIATDDLAILRDMYSRMIAARSAATRTMQA